MKKLYYSIGEASEIAGVKTHVLRYWETQFPELKPSKNKAGKRVYTDKDIEVVLRLKGLIRDKKFSTAGAKKAIKSSENNNQAQPLPVHIRRELNEIKFFLNGLLEKL
jgi:DNA-binding transcriptional MerR regulator